jgi:hypothetical protein
VSTTSSILGTRLTKVMSAALKADKWILGTRPCLMRGWIFVNKDPGRIIVLIWGQESVLR